jgi:hypothetical protein
MHMGRGEVKVRLPRLANPHAEFEIVVDTGSWEVGGPVRKTAVQGDTLTVAPLTVLVLRSFG